LALLAIFGWQFVKRDCQVFFSSKWDRPRHDRAELPPYRYYKDWNWMQKTLSLCSPMARKLLRTDTHIDGIGAPAYGGLGCSRQREGPMNNSHAYPSWSPIYVSAVLETDPHKLPQRIQEAHQAIEGRLSQAPRPDAVEQRALTHARNALTALKSQQPSIKGLRREAGTPTFS
jgi:hypothetical protein